MAIRTFAKIHCLLRYLHLHFPLYTGSYQNDLFSIQQTNHEILQELLAPNWIYPMIVSSRVNLFASTDSANCRPVNKENVLSLEMRVPVQYLRPRDRTGLVVRLRFRFPSERVRPPSSSPADLVGETPSENRRKRGKINKEKYIFSVNRRIRSRWITPIRRWTLLNYRRLPTKKKKKNCDIQRILISNPNISPKIFPKVD